MKKNYYLILFAFTLILLSNCISAVNEGGDSNNNGNESGDDDNSNLKIIFARETGTDPLSGDDYTNIFTMKSDGSDVKQITIGNNFYSRPHFSPDGTKIVFLKTDNDEIFIMNSNGSNIIPLTNNAILDTAPDFSYDGTKIIFTRETGTSGADIYTNIFTMNIDGSNVQQITAGNNFYDRAKFSPDGTKIVFKETVNDDIYIMDSNGTNIIQLTNDPAILNTSPEFTKNSTKILFARETGEDPVTGDTFVNIFTMNIDGSNIQSITNGNNSYDHPHYSPDETKIVFMEFYLDDIFIMDSNGTNITRLTNNSVLDTQPDFSN